MSLPLFFVILAVAFQLLGAIPYFYHIFHGRVVPHPFSWTIWCILSSINTYVLISNTGYSILIISPIVAIIQTIFGAMIGWYFIRKIQITRFDYLCITLAISLIGLVHLFGAVNAVIPTILVDLLVLSPTLRKMWTTPRSEDMYGWLGQAASRLCLLLSLGGAAFTLDSIWWWYVVIINTVISYIIYKRTLYVEDWRNIFRKYLSYFALKNKL